MSAEDKSSRKLVAIMFTDMVGYSALSQQNEALALSLLEEQRAILRPFFPRHHGREIETIGDAFFVEFASALDAVRCAIAIQTALKRRNEEAANDRQIRIRIGLHLGDVVRKGKHVHGDGVNIAARLEPLAPPGGICLSEDIARQVERKIDRPLAGMGRKQLKNITLPMNVFRVVMPWEVDRRPVIKRAVDPLRRLSNRILMVGATALAVVLAAYFFFPRSTIADSKSIAVLPFRNLSSGQENEYFSDGITEDIINALSRVADMKVIAPSTASTFKGMEYDHDDIARRLHVTMILEGSVRRAGNRIRIAVRLIEASSERNVWGQNYDKEFARIFEIQSDVANNVAREVNATLSTQGVDLHRTESMDAYTLFLKGRYHLHKRRPEDLTRSISLFRQALDQDPSYALAFTGLAEAYTVLGTFEMEPPAVAFDSARAAALAALTLDDHLAEAHASLAFVKMHYDRDLEGARKEFQRALELNGNYATAHSWYALELLAEGRYSEANQEMQKAQALDPLSLVIQADAGLLLYFGRKYPEAINHYRALLSRDTTFAAAYIPLGASLCELGRFQEAIEAFSWASLYSHAHPAAIAALGNCYGVSGNPTDANSMLELLLEQRSEHYVPAYWIAMVHAGLGQKDSAFIWLARAVDEHDGALIFLNVEPALDILRGDPRFQSLLRRATAA